MPNNSKKMPDVSKVQKCRAKSSVAKSNFAKSTAHIRELITEKGSVSKVCQFSKSLEEVRDKVQELTRTQGDLDPSSIQTNGNWLEEVEFDVAEVLGEALDYLLDTGKVESQNNEVLLANVINSEGPPVLSGKFQHSKDSGLKGVKVLSFDGNPDKWPYFWGIFSSLVDQNKALSGPIKPVHFNNSFSDKVRDVIACLPGEPGDYEKAVKLLSERYGDPREVVDAHLRRITKRPNRKKRIARDLNGLRMHCKQLCLP